MEIIKKISVDMGFPGMPPHVDAVQGESLSRIVEITTLNGGATWTGGDGSVSIAYKKPDGTSGWYDTLPNGELAVTTKTDSVFRAVLAPEMLTVPGFVYALMRFDYEGKILATFPFVVRVAENPSFGSSKSENYYNVQNWDDVNQNIDYILQKLKSLESENQPSISVPPYFIKIDYYAETGEYKIGGDFEWDSFLQYVHDGAEIGCKVYPAEGGSEYRYFQFFGLFEAEGYASFGRVEGYTIETIDILTDHSVSYHYAIADNSANHAVKYIEQSLTEEQKTQARKNIGVFSDLTEAQASAQLGDELFKTSVTVTLPIIDGNLCWTGDHEEGFTHVAGNTEPLSIAIPNVAAGKRYQVSFACSNEINTSNLQVRIGNSELFELYGQFGAGVKNGVGLTAVDDSPLEFIPSSSFTGRIYDISVREIIAPVEPYQVINDSNGNVALAVRMSDSAQISNTAFFNLFLGVDSGKYITTARDNFGMGSGALEKLTSGFWNVAIGQNALQENDVGSRNIAVGHIALQKNTTGNRNIAIGTFSLPHNTTGHHNIAIGADCMDSNKTGYNNVAIGFGTLRNTEDSYNNVAVGYTTLAVNTTGIGNTALGAFACGSVKTGNDCTAIGRNALYNTNGHYNTAVGAAAGYKNTTGIRNTYIGRGADATDTFFNDCVAIGCGAKVSKSGQTVIGGDNTTETLVKGNLVVKGTDGTLRQIVFNEDGTCSWTAVT